jgi:hypothetical protein
MGPRSLVLLATLITLGSLGCNSSDTAQKQVLGNDWVAGNPSTGTNPAPLPTPSATASVPVASLYDGPAEMASYVSKFVADATVQGVNVLPDMQNPKLTIQIGGLTSYGSATIGLCESGAGLRRVTFDPTFWSQASETQRELLVHHELGHCVLYRAHDTALLPSGAYASIMYPVILASSTYVANEAYYQQELFANKSSALAANGGQDVSVVHVCGKGDL